MPDEKISFLTLVISLFILLNSYAQVPVFCSLLSDFEPKRRRFLIIREMLIALATLLIFIFFGIEVLQIIGITKPVIGLAGGLLLIIIALSMIFPKNNATEGLPKHEPFVVPLAIPGIAGPGAIATVMLFAKTQGILFTSSALFLAWLPSLVVVLSSAYIKEYLGEKGLQAIGRLGGMIIVLIGIQMFSNGVVDLVKDNF